MGVRFISWAEVIPYFKGKTVAVVGSGPGVQVNRSGYIESHDVVVRVNNYKTTAEAGMRTDVHYSFYGSSIRKPLNDLRSNGVKLCMCKCPNSRPIECDWHVRLNKLEGIDYRYIYELRRDWWFCDTFVPEDDHYLKVFEILGRHIPTTGFSAIYDIAACQPKALYLTGFDFFTSGIHNLNERWKPGNPDDPICHRPDLEARWIRENAIRLPLSLDKHMRNSIERI